MLQILAESSEQAYSDEYHQGMQAAGDILLKEGCKPLSVLAVDVYIGVFL